jgi:hypothetical protein
MNRLIGAALGAALLPLVFAAPSLAGASKMKANPFTFDPDHTGVIVDAWQPHTGLPDAGGSDHGLVLQKNAPQATNAAAFAVVTGMEGQTVQSGPTWGWDYQTGTHCGAGAPRFNVEASDGFHFLGGCTHSTQTPGPAPGWTRVRIDPTDPTQAFPPITPGATIQAVAVAFDEQGQTVIDNVLVNGNNTIGKPGNN